MSFHIKQRVLINLKGKGKKMAYLVRGIGPGSFFMRRSETFEP
jgi:hypothetical protein